MAWEVCTTTENDYRPSVEVHPEDEALYWQMVDKLKREQGLWGVNIGLKLGFAFPLPDHPIRLRITSEHRTLPTFLSARLSWAIPRTVIDAIEALEPGVHRYWPLDITMPDGSKAEPRWLLNICNRLETVSPEHSDISVVGTNPAWAIHVPKFSSMTVKRAGTGPEHMVCRKDRIGNHAIWCEFRYQKATFLSNALADSFRRLGMDGLEFELETAEI